MNNLYLKATKGVKWSLLTLIVPKFISPLVTITLARLLLPESFGLITTAMIVISFSQMIWEAGLSQALIQSKELPDKVANVVFWSNIGLGILIYTIIFFLAPVLADYFKSPQSLLVIRVLAIQIILMSFTTVQEALFSKELDFKPLFWIRVSTALLSGGISITMALSGFNVWALVYGTLGASFLNLILLWSKSSWRPTVNIEWDLAPRLFRYGSWVMLLSLLGWFITWFDSILVGRFFGVSDLGIYRTGVTVSSTIFAVVMMPMVTVLFPSFSKLSDNHDKVLIYYHEVNRIIMALVLPAGVGLFLVGREFAIAIFGVQWADLGIVVGILGLSEGLGHICGINPHVYQAIGKPHIQPKISVLLIPIFAAVYWIVAPYGMEPLLWAKLALTVIFTPVNVIIAVKTLKLSPLYLFHQGKYIFASLIVLAICVMSIKWLLYYNRVFDPSTVLWVLVITGILSYAGSLWIFDRSFILKVRSLISSALQK